MSYYVYDNWRRNRGRVHRGDCPHCNNGMGKANSRHGTHDEFLGPFDRPDAFAKLAEKKARREKGPCGVCHP